MVETGRYNQTPRNDRFCPICNSGIIEDEFHFLFYCPKYSFPREKFYNQIQQMPRPKREGWNLCWYPKNILFCVIYASVNSNCAQPPPGLLRGIQLPALSVPGVGHLQILRCPGAEHLPTPGPTPRFWHARSFLSEYNCTKDFTEKNKRIGSFVKDGKQLKRFVKACSRFYACISSLLSSQNYIAKSGAIDVNQRLLNQISVEYYLKNILSYL